MPKPPEKTVISQQEKSAPPDSKKTKLSQYARFISVKVLVGDSWGTGILINRVRNNYTVITNSHVLHEGSNHLVQTYDNKVHKAVIRKNTRLEGYDLALLEFESNADYLVGLLGKGKILEVGEVVFAAGFPITVDTQRNNGFYFSVGQISFVADKILEGGYQIGYTNKIIKGMSGGPVLNTKGKVVGVNGIYAYPLWGNPHLFEDGTHPCEPLRQLMVESSWAIPTEAFADLVYRHTTSKRVEVPKPNFSFSGDLENSNLSLNKIEDRAAILKARAAAARQCLPLDSKL
jgi:hypothetical protein